MSPVTAQKDQAGTVAVEQTSTSVAPTTVPSVLRVADEQMRVMVEDAPVNVVQPELGNAATVVVQQPRVRIVTVGTQGPPGTVPDLGLPGIPGDVMFNNGPYLGADSTNFSYFPTTKTLAVKRLQGTTFDGGNF